MPARPTITDEIAKLICRAASEGVSTRGAARVAGLSEATVFRWLARGRAELEASDGWSDLSLSVLGRFARDFAFAQAKQEEKAIRVLTSVMADAEAPQRDRIKAATWWLERARREDYGPDAGAVEVEAEGEDWADELERRIDALDADTVH